MSDKERRFFRKKYTLFVADDDNNYIKLFDEISKQISEGEDYNEKKIKEGIYSGKFLKNLSFHKNYLYNTILNSLLYFHKDSTNLYSVRSLITQAEILEKKLLHDQSLKLLQRAMRISFECDLLNSQYELVNIERRIIKYKGSIEEYTVKAEELFKEQYRILELQKNLTDYYYLNEKVGIFLRSFGTGWVRKEQELREFEEIYESPLLKNIKNAKSFLTRYIFYNLHLQYQLTKNNFEEAYNIAVLGVELCESNLAKLKGNLDNYIFSLNNLLNCQGRTGRFGECDITADKLRAIEDKFPEMITETNKVFIFYSVSVLMLSINISTLDIEKLKALNIEIENDFKLYEEKMMVYQRIILYYFLTCSNLIQGDYEKCIYWNSKIFNLGKTDLSEDYQCYARIIQLLAYYELGYIDSLEYALKSAYHFISRRKKVYKYENIIQKYLKKSFRIKTNNEMNEIFIEMKAELKPLLNDPFEKNAFDAFNILPWLESKIKNIPVVQVLKESKKSLTVNR
ncbi:MAG: hypothetical protein IPL53_16580 [Ignavibacteria bacterium]|nr:hypothetical protein [Ignavibacteria bacterium]